MKKGIENTERTVHEIVPNHEALGKKPVVLCLCHGNVLRSQWAEFVLNLMGIDAISAALGDVNKQQYQGEVPQHIVEFMSMFSLYGALVGNKIKQIDEETFKSADEVLVFCDPKYLMDFPFIDINDPRIRLMESPDPFGSIDQYEEVIIGIVNAVVNFVRENMSDKLPPTLSEERYYSTVSEFIYRLDRETKETFVEPFSSNRYLVEHGYNIAGVIRQILMWASKRKYNDPISFEEIQLLPNEKQSLQIIEAIEFNRYDDAIRVFSELLDTVTAVIKSNESSLIDEASDEDIAFEDRMRMLRMMREKYASLIRVLERESN